MLKLACNKSCKKKDSNSTGSHVNLANLETTKSKSEKPQSNSPLPFGSVVGRCQRVSTSEPAPLRVWGFMALGNCFLWLLLGFWGRGSWDLCCTGLGGDSWGFGPRLTTQLTTESLWSMIFKLGKFPSQIETGVFRTTMLVWLSTIIKGQVPVKRHRLRDQCRGQNSLGRNPLRCDCNSLLWLNASKPFSYRFEA